MFEIVSTLDLKIGMFVADLDRPWLDSPFLIQGFLIEENEQLAQLRQLCRFVTVDRARSTGAEYRVDTTAFVPEKRLPMTPAQPVIHYQSRKKLALPPLVIIGEREVAGRKFAAIRYDDDVRVEEELPAAKVSYQNTQVLLQDIGDQVSAGKMPDIEHVDRTVNGMVECVVRNPDALLWLSKLKRTDNETYDHALSVSIHLMAFGRHLGLPPDELHALGMGGLLKDIGFIRLPAELVHKMGGLTPTERDSMRQHVNIGCEMLAEEFSVSAIARDIIVKHHERIDGSGYPGRLRGQDIGLYAEMAGVVDSYCAMLYPRAFRPARNGQWVIEEVNSMRDKRFTGSVVDEFVQFVGLYPVGTLVELNSGEVGVVYEQNRVRRLKPRIMLLLGPDKTRNTSPGILNLLNDPLVREGLPYQIVRILPTGSFGLDPKEFYL
ncbi:MAG TPA: HD domain-containing phosphohydrolase [Rhodocyclaceae bacterium]|nr:HD domain-containing phosphohydrolase [Rhodocyclaceae bacterium]